MNLVLIDGNAIMHRAYHALPPLTNKDGQLTNAVYGFLSMLLTITDKLKPTHVIVCFDRPEPTFRKGMYAGYQAKRPKMEDDLSGQFALIKVALEKMDIPIYEKAGYEADDILGTLAWQAFQMSNVKSQMSKVIIVTGDRDILQLVDNSVSVYMPVQGLNNGKLFTPKEVTEKYGITPEQMVDYKALAGDASDNYPGVRGIGPKTASRLLQDFGTLENIYDAIRSKDPQMQRVKEKTMSALSEYAEDAGMAKKLARIVHDAPVTLRINEAKLKPFDTPESLEALQELGFASLVKRVMGVEEKSNQQISKSANKQKKQAKENDSEQFSLV